MEYRNFDRLVSTGALNACALYDVKGLNAERIRKCNVRGAKGFVYNYACMPVSDETVEALQALADEAEVIDKYKALLSGEVMNTGEKRMVLHQLNRGECVDTVPRDKSEFYKAELAKIEKFSQDVRSGAVKGSTGRAFRHVVQIGIGGSDLGPRALCYALNLLPVEKLDARFISNVDPDDAAGVLEGLNLEETLFILVSKSGTTLETLTNRDLVFKVLRDKGITNPKAHMVAVTSETSPLAREEGILQVFFMDDYIGGRYSSCSAVGGVILSLTYGYEIFRELLDGAHAADMTALQSDITKNPALMDALIGVYLRNVLGYPYTAILPYSQSLNRLPAHFQQLDMESNGKSVNRFGERISYKTGPVIFGEPGTNGQHSFYQLLHQGTDIVPLQFMGFRENQGSLDATVEGSTSRQKLNANLVAQIVAFAKGRANADDPNKHFEGGRPSSLIACDRLNAFSLGQILAHFENKVMFQGFIWNLNSFDQEGVQLGKILAKKVLSGCEGDENLAAFAEILL